MGNTNVREEWETRYKPEVLKQKRVPLSLVAEILGHGCEERVREMAHSGMYSFITAVKCKGGHFKYDVYPLRFISWYEGDMP